MRDWAVRAIKTFIQAFFGVLIPAVCTMLSNGWPESIDKVWVILAPTVAAGLAAAIAAVWNIILEALETAPIMTDPVQDEKDRLSVEALKKTPGVPADTVKVWIRDQDEKQVKAKQQDKSTQWDGKL